MVARVSVHFATNRNFVDGDKIFGPDFKDSSATQYVTGSVDVVRWSNAPDTGWAPDRATMKLDPPTNADLSTFPVRTYDLSAFAVDQTKAEASGSSPCGLILLPGFASTFIDALARAAQIANGYQARDVFVFSWPANGIVDIPNYRLDRRDAEKSALTVAHAILHLLRTLDALPAAAKPNLNVVAHSMGTFTLRHALQHVVRHDPTLIKPGMLSGALLMAPDEADDALARADMMGPLCRMAKRVVVYHADGDLALAISRIENRWSPLGLFKPRDLAQLPQHVTAINCSDVASTHGDDGQSHFRHQYYRLSPWVIRDVRQVLADIAPDRISGRLRDPIDPAGDRAWWVPYDTIATA